MGPGFAAVARFVNARNARDTAGMAAAATPDLEMRLSRGTEHGVEGIRAWVERMSFGVAPVLELGDVIFARGDALVVCARQRYVFVDGGDPAGEWTESSLAFVLRDGKVAMFAPHSDVASALTDAGLGEADSVAR